MLVVSRPGPAKFKIDLDRKEKMRWDGSDLRMPDHHLNVIPFLKYLKDAETYGIYRYIEQG